MLICSLCLKEIKANEDKIVMNDSVRHKSCSDELEIMIAELEKISRDNPVEDI